MVGVRRDSGFSRQASHNITRCRNSLDIKMATWDSQNRFLRWIHGLCEVAMNECELNWSANKGKTQVAPFILFVKGVAATGLHRTSSLSWPLVNNWWRIKKIMSRWFVYLGYHSYLLNSLLNSNLQQFLIKKAVAGADPFLTMHSATPLSLWCS